MNYRIEEIEGIGSSYGRKLSAAGIKTTGALLKACATPAGRRMTAEKTGISETRLLEWANLADLMRISGIGKQFSELLEAAGVDTVKELKNRNAANLAEQMRAVNARKKLARTSPSHKSIEKWVAQAKKLPAVLRY